MPRIPSVTAFLKPDNGYEPTEAEQRLITACQKGEHCILSNERPTGPTEANTIRAELIRLLILGGTKDCGLDDSGVGLKGGWIRGILDLRFAKGQGGLTLAECYFQNAPYLEHARLDQLNLDGSKLPGLRASHLELSGALFLEGTEMTGPLSLVGARIGGQLNCVGAKLDDNGGVALNGQGMTLGDSLFLRAAKVRGCITLAGSQIGGQVVCVEAELDGNGGKALNGQGMTLGQSLFLRGVTATGCIGLNGSRIGGQLACEGAKLDGNGSMALNGQSMSVTGGLLFREVEVIMGDLILTAAQVGDLVDDFASWNKINGYLNLDGFTYDRLFGSLDIPGRLRWLKQGAWFDGTFSPQPYTQLAKTLAAMGHNRAARRVLYEREEILGQEQLREDRKRLSELWRDSRGEGAAAQEVRADIGVHWCRMRFSQVKHWLARRIVGHGYLPERALIVSLKVLTVATLGYFIVWRAGGMVPNSDVVMTSAQWAQAMAENPAAPAHAWEHLGAGQHYETFNAFAYAADVFVPLFDLGQESAWAATTANFLGTMAWGAKWLLQGMGWLVSALGVAAITGIMQKDRD